MRKNSRNKSQKIVAFDKNFWKIVVQIVINNINKLRSLIKITIEIKV